MTDDPTPIWSELEPRWLALHGPINPDCRDGKHPACAGDAWNDDEDESTMCACDCHTEPGVVDVVDSL